MTDFLSRLVDRVQGTTATLRPRAPSRFDASADDRGIEEISEERLWTAPALDWTAPPVDPQLQPAVAAPLAESGLRPPEPVPRQIELGTAEGRTGVVPLPEPAHAPVAPVPTQQTDAGPTRPAPPPRGDPPDHPIPTPEEARPAPPAAEQIAKIRREVVVETRDVTGEPPESDLPPLAPDPPVREELAASPTGHDAQGWQPEDGATRPLAPLQLDTRRPAEPIETQAPTRVEDAPIEPPAVHLRIDRIEVNVAPPKPAPRPRRASVATSDLETFLNKLEGRS